MPSTYIGFCWHLHHKILLEWCHDYNERVEYIKSFKPRHEKELRLRLFRPIRGKLPQEVIETGQAYAQARQAHLREWQAYDQARESSEQAQQAYYSAQRVYIQALERNITEINALHAVECVDCPWDGHTIFPGVQGSPRASSCL